MAAGDLARAGAGRLARRPPFRRGRRGLRRRERSLGYAMVAPAVIALLLITAFPLFYNAWNSVHHMDLLDPATKGEWAGALNYLKVLTDQSFVPSLARTAAFTAVSVAVELTVGLGIALALSRGFRGRGAVRAAVFIPWAVPTVVSAMLWKTMFDQHQGFVDFILGALHLPGANTTWLAGPWTAWFAVLVTDAWKNIPFMVILLLAGLQIIPGELYEAARIDGAGPWQAFWRVTIPMLKPALMVSLVFRTLQAFLIFDVIYIMTGGGPGTSTETVQYLDWRAFLVDADFGYGGAVAIIVVVIALLIAAAYVRLMRAET